VIKDHFLILTDATMVYALNKHTGKVIWSRTAMADEQNMEKYSQQYKVMNVEGIYSDPTIHGDEILYGTRNVFIARKVANGHLTWNRTDIKSYSGFPVFYDDYIFTQSMDYSAGRFTVHCLDLATGREIWKKDIEKPLKIFSPVVNQKKVYFPSGTKIFVLDLATGRLMFEKDYKEYITSDLSFTAREIVFSLGNKDIVIVDPDTGDISQRIPFDETGNPWFVLTRDQVYVAKTTHENRDEKKPAFTMVTALKKDNPSVPLWNFKSPFPGSPSQPVSSGGVLFVPSGNYLYALGDRMKTTLVKKGNDYVIEKMDEKGNKSEEKAIRENVRGSTPDEKKVPPVEPPLKPSKILKVKAKDEGNQDIKAEVEVIERDGDKIVSRKKFPVDKDNQDVIIPDSESVELIVTAPDRIPQKVIVKKTDTEAAAILEKIEAGKSFNVENIEFEINQDYLKVESLEILKKLSDILKKNPSLKTEITGHTDSTGEAKYNQGLSERRAEAVSDFLIKQGISPLRLKTKGMGEEKPVAPNDTEEGRRKNRRTEFYLFQ
jgi:outer membrane protein OmpA-like peptidoglycan-associated protein/outer membrane protein assembly factor BamB